MVPDRRKVGKHNLIPAPGKGTLISSYDPSYDPATPAFAVPPYNLSVVCCPVECSLFAVCLW
jgi:hypothetical protein